MIKKSLVLFIVMAFLTACAGLQQMQDDPNRAYLAANEQYIALGNLYLKHKDKIENPETRAKIRDAFGKADLALEAWKTAIVFEKTSSKGEIDALLILEQLAIIIPQALEAVE